MAIAFAQNLGDLNTASGTSLSGTFGSSTVSGNMILAAARIGVQGRTQTFSDSKSNTWASPNGVELDHAIGNHVSVGYALNITGGAAHQLTVSISGAAASIRMVLWEEAGIATASALDKTHTAIGNETDPSQPDSGATATTTQADEWIFCVAAVDGGGTITVGTGFGHLIGAPAGTAKKMSAEDKIVAATGTYNGGFTYGAGYGAWGCAILTFKGAGAGGSNQAVVPAAVNATSAVTASAQRLAAITPAAVTSSSPVTASLTALKQLHAAVAATSTVTAAATRIASLQVAAVNATSSVGAAISGIAQNVLDNFRVKKRRRL